MKNYKTYIFDLDGTLIDSRADITAGANYALNKLGLSSKDSKEIISYTGKGLKHLVKSILPNNSTDEKVIEAYNYLKFYYETKATLSTPYKNVLELLEKLQIDSKLFIVTNKTEKATMSILSFLDMTKYFKAIYGADSLKEKKPSPYPINYISEKFNINKKDILFIGDSITDYRTSIASKVDFLLVEHGFESKEIRDSIKSPKIPSFNLEYFNY